MQKKITLVTGGLGFIGSNLVDELITNNHKVFVIDNLITGSKSYSNNKAEYDFFDLANESKLFSLVNKIVLLLQIINFLLILLLFIILLIII